MFGNKLSELHPFIEQPGPAEQLAENAALAHAPQPLFIAADELMEPVEEQGYDDNRSQLVVCANLSPSTARNKLVVGLTLPNLHISLNDWARSKLVAGLTSSKSQIPSNGHRG